MINRGVENAYKIIKNSKIKYGTYYKTLFHLHTPQSYDYKLRKRWEKGEYKEKTEIDILNECIREGALPKTFELQKYELVDDLKIYSDKKEWLSYVLLAHSLLKNHIEIVVVTDHNTIDGIKKLEVAISNLYKMRVYDVYTEVIWGIEISCADKLHVVGIFDCNETKQNEVNMWLEENLLPENQGTYLTSLQVLEFFTGIDAITYIAHINSAPIFTEKKYLSGGYKKKLLESKFCHILGVHCFEQKKAVIERLSEYKGISYNFVIDNDAHDIDDLDKNYFWIKGSKRSFSMIREALDDFNISVGYDVETPNKKYIAGIYIEPAGFLCDKNKSKGFLLKFSPALNCFIGGRGTGKSTVLQILDYCLSQNVSDEKTLDFICKHGNTYILYVDGDKEYIIEMLMPFKTNKEESILRYFGQNMSNRCRYKYYMNVDGIKGYARKEHLTIYEVARNNDNICFFKTKTKTDLLNNFFDNKYSVNDLVRTASGDEINSFIETLMFTNKIISNPESVIKARSESGLSKMLRDMEDLFAKRKAEVEEVLSSFNESQKSILRIEYSQNEIVDEPDFMKWIGLDEVRNEKWFKNYAILKENIISYIYNVYDQVGITELLRMAVDKKYIPERYKYSIKTYAEENTFSMVENNLVIVTEKNEKQLIDNVFESLISTENLYHVLEYLKKMARQTEKFSLMFNINSKTSKDKEENYKDVMTLSLGQKVVAMLDFVLGYGEYIGDFRPVLIDQPEDNLDSQYIYKNLVKQLRNVKRKRQIIIATHNATIVTNAMTDQVCVMQSDGVNGWVEAAGYTSEKRIKKNIVNYLEGGVESFNHKIQVYKEIL